MIVHDYTITPTGEVHRQREIHTDQLPAESLAAVRRAIDGDAEAQKLIAGFVGARLHWTDDPVGTLSIWDGDSALCVAVMLRDASESEALEQLAAMIEIAALKHGAVADRDWTGLVLDYPCVVTALLWAGRASQHMAAGDIIQHWAAAWFDR